MNIRTVEDRDAQDLSGLVTLCFAQYPGCYVDPHDDMPDLVMPTVWTTGRNGAFWVVEDETSRICACAGVDLPQAGVAEMHRVYVRPNAQRQGLARTLLGMAEAWAISKDAKTIVAWSDSRFTNAHAMYRARGYVQQADERILGDVSNTTELFFIKTF
jgi:putative acetyltransferase